MTTQHVIALLGRRDEPTDAVEEYCRHLGEGLAAHHIEVQIRRVPWNEHGWASSLEALRLQAESWRDTTVLVQYTALAWSRRGFPRRFQGVLRILRRAGAKCVVVFHDVTPFSGLRLIDRIRRAHQIRVMRAAQSFADQSVLTVALDHVSWLRSNAKNAVFIPVGANLPFALALQEHLRLHSPPTVGVFSITGGSAGDRETGDIVAAVRIAANHLGALRLLVFGRYAELREKDLREGLRDSSIDVQVEGIVETDDLPGRFAASDVLLFVRGTISSRRGSAIAGIACGLPVIAFQGEETASPITDAGVLFLPEDRNDQKRRCMLGNALVTILSDHGLRNELITRSRAIHAGYLSWTAIASRYAQLFGSSESRSRT